MSRQPVTEQTADSALKGMRPAYFHEIGDFVDTPVYDRYRLAPGMHFSGPAIIEERESTAIIRPGMAGEADAYLNLHIRLTGIT
jgi:N-methylhydantoinase A